MKSVSMRLQNEVTCRSRHTDMQKTSEYTTTVPLRISSLDCVHRIDWNMARNGNDVNNLEEGQERHNVHVISCLHVSRKLEKVANEELKRIVN